jgi:hypothetical protein
MHLSEVGSGKLQIKACCSEISIHIAQKMFMTQKAWISVSMVGLEGLLETIMR